MYVIRVDYFLLLLVDNSYTYTYDYVYVLRNNTLKDLSINNYSMYQHADFICSYELLFLFFLTLSLQQETKKGTSLCAE